MIFSFFFYRWTLGCRRTLDGNQKKKEVPPKAELFFVSRLLGVLHVVGGFQKKVKKKDTEHERVYIFCTTEHVRDAMRARATPPRRCEYSFSTRGTYCTHDVLVTKHKLSFVRAQQM